MKSEPSHGDLRASIARLETALDLHMRSVNARLRAVEQTQRDLVSVATQGKTGLRVLIWVGGSQIGRAHV